MALVPLECPRCSTVTGVVGTALEVRVVAGTAAWSTARWRCGGCRQSVVLCLTDREWAQVSEVPGVRPRVVDPPVVDQPHGWGPMDEDEVLEAWRAMQQLTVRDPREPA